MASAGDVIENPIQGDRIVFRSTARETHGEALALEVFVPSGAAGSPYHIHPRQEERFKVIAGVIRARIDGRDHRFTTGDECVVAQGIPHTWWNAGPTEARVLVEYRPASRMETFLETIYGLVQDGKTDDKGVPNLMQRAVFARAYFDVCHLTRPPLAIQKALFGLLSPLGRLLGYRADYPYPYEAGRRLSAPDSTLYLHPSTQPRSYYP